MPKWGITFERELKDIATILQKVMRMQLETLRPKWSQQFGEEALRAVECVPGIEEELDT